MQCDRKTVGRNINYLIEFGCAIIKSKNGVCYLLNNETISQCLKMLIFNFI